MELNISRMARDVQLHRAALRPSQSSPLLQYRPSVVELNISRMARAALSLSVAPSGEAPITSLLDWPLTVKEEDYLSAAELAQLDGSETRPHTSRPHTSLYAAIPDDRRRSSSTASQITSPGTSFATSTFPMVVGRMK